MLSWKTEAEATAIIIDTLVKAKILTKTGKLTKLGIRRNAMWSERRSKVPLAITKKKVIKR